MLITHLFKTLLCGLGYLLLAGIFLLLWGLIGQCFWGQGKIFMQSEQLREHEVNFIHEQLGKPLLMQVLAENILVSKKSKNELEVASLAKALTPLTGLEQLLQKNPRLKTFMQKFVVRLKITQQIFLVLWQTLTLRLLILLLFLPLFGLLGLVGFVDGLVQRHVRKGEGARESSVLYQRIKEWIAPSFFGAGILYIGLPLRIDPMHWFLTFALLLSVLLSLAARNYKKYL